MRDDGWWTMDGGCLPLAYSLSPLASPLFPSNLKP